MYHHTLIWKICYSSITSIRRSIRETCHHQEGRTVSYGTKTILQSNWSHLLSSCHMAFLWHSPALCQNTVHTYLSAGSTLLSYSFINKHDVKITQHINNIIILNYDKNIYYNIFFQHGFTTSLLLSVWSDSLNNVIVGSPVGFALKYLSYYDIDYYTVIRYLLSWKRQSTTLCTDRWVIFFIIRILIWKK